MEFVPILIPTSTKTLRVLYKYFILFQQQTSQSPDAWLAASVPVLSGQSLARDGCGREGTTATPLARLPDLAATLGGLDSGERDRRE